MLIKRFILVLACYLVLTSTAYAQATKIQSSGTLPTHCTVGSVYIKTGSSAGFYICLTINTWTGPLSAGGSGTVTHTGGALTANRLVIGAGTDDVAALGSLGTTTTLLHGNAAGAPTFGQVNLASSDVTGVLPVANFATGTPTGTKFVRDDGTLQIPGGASLADGDYGDVTVSSSGSTLTIDNDVVTPAKMNNGAAISVLGRSANSSGDRADIAATTVGQAMQYRGTTVQFSNIGIPVFARKASDESVTSSTTLQDDDDLLFSVNANETWVADFSLYVFSASATPKLDYRVTVPTAATVKTSQDNVVFSVNANSGDIDRFSQASGSEPNTYVASSGPGGTAQLVQFHVIVVGGANAGTVQLQWAQHVSNGSATIVQANSHMVATRYQ